MTSTTNHTQTVTVWGDRITLSFSVFGTGPALVYLHPLAGAIRDDFLDELARDHTVYMPELPGTGTDDSSAIHEIDDITELVLVYEEALSALDLRGVPVVGQSFGGMLAAELASFFPDLFSRVVLLGPVGLWVETAPWSIVDLLSAPPSQFAGLLFSNPAAERPQALLTLPDDPQAAVGTMVSRVWSQGCGAKFQWPLPDRGLSRRLHRLTAPALIIWGEDDRIVPVSYADEFATRITDSRVHVLPDSGHIPQVEQMEATLELVSAFLADS